MTATQCTLRSAGERLSLLAISPRSRTGLLLWLGSQTHRERRNVFGSIDNRILGTLSSKQMNHHSCFLENALTHGSAAVSCTRRFSVIDRVFGGLMVLIALFLCRQPVVAASVQAEKVPAGGQKSVVSTAQSSGSEALTDFFVKGSVRS